MHCPVAHWIVCVLFKVLQFALIRFCYKDIANYQHNVQLTQPLMTWFGLVSCAARVAKPNCGLQKGMKEHVA